MTTTTAIAPTAPATPEQAPFPLRVLNWLAEQDRLYREKRRLTALSDEHLADMGLTRQDADSAFYRRRYRDTDTRPLPITWRRAR